MKYKFKNGAEVDGTLDQILEIAKSLGEVVDLGKLGAVPVGYYQSEHKGIIKISDMADVHIRNALLKMSRKWFEALGKETGLTNSQFMKRYVSLTDQSKINELFVELSKRK
jgi:hypothetical protein